MMDEDFLDVTQSGNKLVAFVLITITLFIIVFGYFFVYQKFHFSLKKVKVEVNSSISENINDYLKKKVVDTSGYKLDISDVKIGEVGEYTYTVSYNNRTKKSKISVVDTTPPVFTTQDMTVEAGSEDVFLGNFLTSCEDYSKPCLVTFKNESDEKKLKIPGTYEVVILISDLYKNKSEAKVNLTVVEKLVDERTTDLEYASSSIKLDDFVDQYYAKLERAIDPDSHEAETTASEMSNIDLEEYVKENYEGYELKSSEFIEIYNKSSFVIGYAIRITIDNGVEKTVYVTE